VQKFIAADEASKSVAIMQELELVTWTDLLAEDWSRDSILTNPVPDIDTRTDFKKVKRLLDCHRQRLLSLEIHLQQERQG